jgi:hypothetical protein
MDNFDNIKKIYEKTTYFDQYGSSFFLLLIITIVLILGVSYCFILAHIQPIKDDWSNQRCKPYIIPFAGIINTPDGDTLSNFTSTNFTYCTQTILQGITGEALKPLTFITASIQAVVDSVKEAINSIRAMMDKIRTQFQSVSQEIMGRLMNITIPLQQIIISFKDFMGKIQGVMTAGLFTSLGTYYTLKALLGAIAQFIIMILIALAVIIVILWIVPFTWGAAAANTAIFTAIAIPMALILSFMVEVLQVHPSLSIPSVKCFDKDTLFEMNNGEKKPAYQVKVGDTLKKSGKITAKMVVETKGSQMYKLHDIIVSDSHKVYFQEKWIFVSQHPGATLLKEYCEPFLYCFNTDTKTIILNDTVFADWDDLEEKDITFLLSKIRHLGKKENVSSADIHRYVDGGFIGTTPIILKNGLKKNIQDVKVGDVLEKGENVYGIVEIDARNMEQKNVALGKRKRKEKIKIIKGGTNLCFCSSPVVEKVFHLLTDSKTFFVRNTKVHDYNACIDLFFPKEKEKEKEKENNNLLSMKYV